jgi:hypothetical protein
MKQQTLAQGSFKLYRKPTKREKFLNGLGCEAVPDKFTIH